MPKTVSIVIPCYNEEKTIEELLRRVEVADFGSWQKEIIVVDDGSKDRSRDILATYVAKPQYKVIFQSKNGGKGVAERAGIKASTGDYVVLQDADLEYHPQEIKRLLEKAEETGAPIVFGSRNIGSPWKRARKFFNISVGVWVSTKLVNILYGLKLTDAWTCYKLFSRKVADSARFIGDGFEADYLFIGDAAALGYPIVEVEISHTPRTQAEGKKIRYKDGIVSMTHLIMHRLLHLRKPNVSRTVSLERQNRIAPFLVSPVTGDPVSIESGVCVSKQGESFPKSASGIPLLIENVVFEVREEEHVSGVNWLKSFFKQFPKLYYGIWNIFCPVLMFQNPPRLIYKYIKKNDLVLDVGAGPARMNPYTINLDVFPFEGVDVVGSADKLPFKDGAFDGLVSESLLEHVTNSWVVANEMSRVVKPGGYIYLSAPFIHPFHASPDDFNRFTTSALKAHFADFSVVELGVRSGPVSAFLMSLAYFLGVVFSFGNRKLAPVLAHVFMLVIGPFKIFDLLFSWIPGIEAVSAHLYIIGQKKS